MNNFLHFTTLFLYNTHKTLSTMPAQSSTQQTKVCFLDKVKAI